MTLHAYANFAIAGVLLIMAVSMMPTFVRRFPFVGLRYRTTVVSGYVFVLCAAALYVLDPIQWADTRQTLGMFQAIAGIVFAILSIGDIDIVFNNRSRRVRSNR